MSVIRIGVIDSHTAGEPTRLIMEGGPDLGRGPLCQRRDRFCQEFDHYRRAVVNEPRGNDVLVGGLLCVPHDPSCHAGVIFFNNVGYLGMCGHGMMGVVATLKHLGQVEPGEMRVETPVGIVTAILHPAGSVSIQNVDSYRAAKDVVLDVKGVGRVTGDVAWGGNWFFLVNEPCLDFAAMKRNQLVEWAAVIRQAINQAGFPEVDHVELFGAPLSSSADSQNFVLCPGGQFDRSPCGTGTSAKLACLAADGKLEPGQTWTQAGILGTEFRGSYQWASGSSTTVIPTITGTAHVVAETSLLLAPDDPFRWGFDSCDSSH